MDEIWLPYLTGEYEVSNQGRVRRAVAGPSTQAGRIKKASVPNSSGYYLVGLFVKGKRTNVYVHKAVAALFIGPCPVGFEVNHKDGNKLNCRADNLEYLTKSGNAKHAYLMGLAQPPTERARGAAHWTRKHPELVKRGGENGAVMHPEAILRGEACPASKLTEAAVRSIRRLAGEGVSYSAIGRQFGVTSQNVRFIAKGLSWKHVS